MTACDDTGPDIQSRRLHAPMYRINGDIYVFSPGRERCFRYAGATRNPRVVALHDAAVYNGALDTVHTDGALLELQHHVAGIETTLFVGDFFDEPIPVFDEPERLVAGDVAKLVGGGSE